MNIKSKLKLITRGLWSTLFIISVSFAWTFLSIDKDLTQDRYVARTMVSVSAVSNLLREFILHQDQQAVSNWDKKQKQFSRHLHDMPQMSISMKNFAIQIEKRQTGIITLFQYLKRLKLETKISKQNEMIDLHIVDKMFIQIEAIREDAIRLILMSNAETKKTILHRGLIFIFIVLISVFFMTSLSRKVFRNIDEGLSALTNATIEAGRGQFKQQFKDIPNDEFGNLAIAFNKMLIRLNETTISRDSLQTIVDERTKELKELSETDSLTKIPNRRFYDQRIVSDIAMAKRNHSYLSLLMIDIDFFKKYNDNFGHDLGDIVLTRVAQTIEDTLPRLTDSVSRFGGEEFVVILPLTDKKGAKVIAERIRLYILALKIPCDHQDSDDVLTVSVGITTLDSEQINEIELLKQADLALYKAKKKGRNLSLTFESGQS